jgi:oxygen-independent coproporphyrinogen-3 oxidase
LLLYFCSTLETITQNLIQKYNVAGPRYTSYPTVPYWDENLNTETWLSSVKETFKISNIKEGISLYIHLPFCESLCTYCGCNKHITKNHALEQPHLNFISQRVAACILTLLEPKSQRLKNLHLGGGTPTFFSPQNLKNFIEGILKYAIISNNAALSFEAHPGNTTMEHLIVLRSLGFTRISLGVQDFNPIVQKAIHRLQSFEQTQEATINARQAGYDSINFDLIYGLPFQTLESMIDTIKKQLN